MIKGKKHLTQDNRYVIQDMLYDNKSATQIARYIGVNTSTITRKIKNNRLGKIPKRTHVLPSRICKYKDQCNCKRSLCERCVNPNTLCKKCKKRKCTSLCDTFVHVTCPITEKCPYIWNPHCDRRNQCIYPKCSYKAKIAENLYRKKLIVSRQGINMTEEEYIAMCNKVIELIKNGQSPRVIWQNHPNEFPVSWRSYYSYAHDEKRQEICPIDFPRMKRYKPRKKQK